MRLRGKGINPGAVLECVSFLIFGLLLFRLTFTGEYLNYVTPRMKPYLYGLSALMMIWAFLVGKHLLRPSYKIRMSRCFTLLIPILILAVPPVTPASGAMIKDYSNIPMASSEADSDSYEAYEEEAIEKPETYEDTDSNSSSDQFQTFDTQLSQSLNGLDDQEKTITISDEDFSIWMNELGSNGKAYEGYTVTLKGFIFLDMEERPQQEFALVRLSMWCCSADLSPIGLMVRYDGDLAWKEDDWITVTGKIAIEDGYPTILAERMEAAEKPAEEYVYPYY